MSINCLLQTIDADTVERLLANPSTAGPTLSHLRLPSCDIHKAWQAIHYVLTGSSDSGSEPNCFLLKGGVMLGSPTDDFDPPRLLRPAQVQAWNDVLQPINKLSVLRSRFDHEAMVEAGVYSMNEGEDNEAEDLEFTAEFFKLLRKFIKRAAEAGHGVIVATG